MMLSPLRKILRPVLRGVVPCHSGNLFNGTYAFFPMKTHGRSEVGDSEITVFRDGDKFPVMLNGTIGTFYDNEGAYVGNGLNAEGAATNLFYQNDISTWSGFTSYTGGTVPCVDPLLPNIPLIDFEDVRLFPTTTSLTVGLNYVNSLWIYANKAVTVGVRNTKETTESVALVAGWQRVKLGTQIAVATSTNAALIDARFSQGFGVVGLELAIFTPQVVQSSSHSSDVYTTIAPASRAAEFVSAPTSNAYVVETTLGDLTTGNYVNGVNTSGRFLAFYGDYDSNWDGHIPTSIAGARIVSKSGIYVEVESFTNASLIRYVTTPLFTDAEIQAAFQYVDDGNGGNANKITINFSLSAIPDLATMYTLRSDVGDIPPTQLDVEIEETPTATGVTKVGNTILIDGTYVSEAVVDIDATSSTLAEISSNDIFYFELEYTVNSGSAVVSFFGQTLIAGTNIIRNAAGAVPLPAHTVLVNVDGTIDCEIKIVSRSIRRWLTFKPENFELSFGLELNTGNYSEHDSLQFLLDCTDATGSNVIMIYRDTSDKIRWYVDTDAGQVVNLLLDDIYEAGDIINVSVASDGTNAIFTINEQSITATLTNGGQAVWDKVIYLLRDRYNNNWCQNSRMFDLKFKDFAA